MEEDILKAELEKLNLEKEEIAANKKKQSIVYLIICFLLFAALVFFYEKNQTIAKASIESAKKKDSLDLLAENLSKNNTVLKGDIQQKIKEKDSADSLVKTLKLNNSRLSAKTRELTETSQDLLNVNSQNLAVIKDLKAKTEQLKSKTETTQGTNKPDEVSVVKKYKSVYFNIFKTQSDSLIAGLQQTDPFVALALAQSNYRQVEDNAGSDTVEMFKKTFINVYNNTDFFTRRNIKFNKFIVKSSRQGQIMDMQYDTINNKVICRYVLSNINSPESKSETINFTERSDTPSFQKASFDVFYPNTNIIQTKVVTNGFSTDGELFYSINRSPRPKETGFMSYFQIGETVLHNDTLKVWKITGNGLSAKPIWTKSIDVKGFDNFSIAFRTNKLLVFPIDKRSNLSMTGTVYDLKELSESAVTILNRAFRREASRIADVSDDFKYVLTNYHDYYKIYDANSPDKLDTVYKKSGDKTLLYFKFDNDSEFKIYKNSSNRYSFEFSSIGRKVKEASVSFPDGFVPVTGKIIKSSNGFICFNRDGSSLEIWTKDGSNWSSKEFDIVPKGTFASLISGTLSHNGKYFAAASSNNLLVYEVDHNDKKAIFTFRFPALIEHAPLFNEKDNQVVVESADHLYYVFFDKQQKNSADDIKKLLSSGYYKGAWPVAQDKLGLYGIKGD